jgi:branched-chain amino acid transport system permease protein
MSDSLLLDRETKAAAPSLNDQGGKGILSGASGVAAFIALFFLPLLTTNDYQMHLIDLICLNIILAVGLNIVKGFTGQVTVGHIGLYAVGAYASAILSINFNFPFWVALPCATLITAFIGLIVGIPSIRLEGAYLALVTLGFAETVRIVLLSTEYFGTSLGISGIPAPEIAGIILDTPRKYYYLLMPITALGIYASFSILRSAIGRAFMAIREDQLAAAAAGVDVQKYKLLAFVISAIYAGAAGSLFAHLAPGYIHPNSFTITEMVVLLLMVVIGGIGRIWGGVVGAILVTVIHDYLRDYYQYEYLAFGIIIALSVTYMPKGIGGLVFRFVNVRRFRAIREKSKREREAAK